MIFCIPPKFVDKLKQSAFRDEVDLTKLADEMTSAERREFFAKFTDKNIGKFINTEFEKALVSNKKGAMVDWAKSVFDPKSTQPVAYKNIVDKINQLDKDGLLNPKSEQAFMEDLVADKLGIKVSPEEVRIISEKAKVIQEKQAALGDNLGDPAYEKEITDFLSAKAAMDEYLLSKNPSSNLAVLTGTTGRGAMLASLKSPVLNIGSNTIVGAHEAAARRITKLITKGDLKTTDSALSKEYQSMAQRIYQKTGYDITRMMTLEDGGVSGGRVLGDMVHAEGPGLNRKIGRGVQKVVFKQLMGAPDVFFAAKNFGDSLNLNAIDVAKGNAKLAKEYMRDAMRLDPKTNQGKILREQGIMDAQVATWTNESWANKVSGGIRKILNDVTGDARVGDYVLPFVKTPANVLATGIDYGGGHGVRALIETYDAFKKGELRDPEFIKSVTSKLVKNGLGLVGAVVIANQLSDDDFMGAYDPNQAQIAKTRNAPFNAIRVGGKWISTDWLGPLQTPVTAMMYAKKYGGSEEKIFQYARSLIAQGATLPGLELAANTYKTASNTKDQSFGDAMTEAESYLLGEAKSRLVPSFITDIAKSLDPYERETKKDSFGPLKSIIPGLRQTLPIKSNVFGDPIKTEGVIPTMLLGSRFKTDVNSPVIQEIIRVSKAVDKSINFSDWDRSSATALVQFKNKVGAFKFEQAKLEYGHDLKRRLDKRINESSYQKLDDEEKLKDLRGIDTEAQKKVFKDYNFKPLKKVE
ncbi:MAG: hypothetical protein KBC72_00595 [Acinetobacter sp.]|nr:hypothetical protein [Acinetobacter sp.]